MHTRRLNVLVAAILAVPLAGCRAMDDEACLYVDPGQECPAPAEARKSLVGDETCQTPVRKVTRTGKLIDSYDIEGRDTGWPSTDTTQCCYEAAYRETSATCVVGRPIRVGRDPVVAASTSREDWVGPLAETIDRFSGEQREHRAASWLTDALHEHGSVAAFARLTLDLLALGAPAELVTRTAAAQADEIRHATQCFALASAYAGRALGPGPMPPIPTAPPDLVRLAVEAFEDGCVGETLAVCRAAVQLRQETDPVVRAVLEGIIADETRHAALAWDLVRWTIAQGGEPVREAVALAAERISPPARELPWGAAFEAAIAQVVLPTTQDLLAA